MLLADILDPACVLVPLDAPDESSAIIALVDVLGKAGRLTDRDAALKAVLTRENVRHTGIGMGLAVPHAKCSECQTISMAIGVLPCAVDCGCQDGTLCDFIILLVSPASDIGGHIRALAHAVRLWISEDFRRIARESKDATELFAAVNAYWSP